MKRQPSPVLAFRNPTPPSAELPIIRKIRVLAERHPHALALLETLVNDFLDPTPLDERIRRMSNRPGGAQ